MNSFLKKNKLFAKSEHQNNIEIIYFYVNLFIFKNLPYDILDYIKSISIGEC